MRSVFKYPVKMVDTFNLTMPENAKVLSVQMQHGQPFLWALVDPSAQKREYHFRVAGTGHGIDESVKQFIGTFQMHNGDLVFHLFLID